IRAATVTGVQTCALPILLFRVVGRNPRVLSRLMAGGLLDRGSISMRQRELMILRTTAICGAEYEWGVHVAAYGAKSNWTQQELRSEERRVGTRWRSRGAR